MAVITVPIGPKRIAITAYCPDDILGIALCEYALSRIQEFFRENPVSEETARRALVAGDPRWESVFAALDDGARLRKNPAWCVDPANAGPETEIIEHLRAELNNQRKRCARPVATV